MKRTNFLNAFNRATFRMVLLFIVGVWVTGCGPRTVPVSTTTTKTEKHDSTLTKKSEIRKDSTYVETVTEKILPGSSVGITLTKAQVDSLIRSLQAMPSSVTRTIYKQDPTMRTTLKITLDSLGQLHFDCLTASKTYLEKLITATRSISDLETELVKVKNENSLLTKEIRLQKKSIWEAIKEKLGFALWVVVFAACVCAYGFILELKKKYFP